MADPPLCLEDSVLKPTQNCSFTLLIHKITVMFSSYRFDVDSDSEGTDGGADQKLAGSTKVLRKRVLGYWREYVPADVSNVRILTPCQIDERTKYLRVRVAST